MASATNPFLRQSQRVSSAKSEVRDQHDTEIEASSFFLIAPLKNIREDQRCQVGLSKSAIRNQKIRVPIQQFAKTTLNFHSL